MPNVLHRFTPPTCTLEIQGNKFLGSKQILKDFQFQLKFDDPRLSTSKQITIIGDRQNLEQLQTAIDKCLQRYLSASFRDKIDGKDLTGKNQFQDTLPYLQSAGLDKFELFLGSLRHDSETNKLKLTTVQLFDLVTALEAYRDRLATVPESKSSPAKKVSSFWGVIAIAAAIGVSITGFLFRTQPVPNISSVPQTQPSAPIPELDEVVPPQTTTIPRQPTAKPKLREPLSSATRLPPPPAVDTPKPKPNIPDPADYPLPEVARQSGVNTTKENIVEPPTVPKIEETILSTSRSPVVAELAKPDAESTIKIDPDTETHNHNKGAIAPDTIAKDNGNQQTISSRSQPSQLQQAITYFQQRWQPPTELKQSLEYRLWLNADGSIDRVVPLGKASRLYLAQANIPIKGESFISSPQSQPSIIRLLLNPDGKVQGFKE
jgi:hypothetical protein